MTGTKTCKGCSKRLPLSDFYVHSEMSDGHLNKCKACVTGAVRAHRRSNDNVREYDRERAKAPERKAKARKTVIDFRKKNEAAYRAQTAVSNAVRDGKLKKEPCYFCGTTANINAHHSDYSAPLNVHWLCSRCHHRLHAVEASNG